MKKLTNICSLIERNAVDSAAGVLMSSLGNKDRQEAESVGQEAAQPPTSEASSQTKTNSDTASTSSLFR